MPSRRTTACLSAGRAGVKRMRPDQQDAKRQRHDAARAGEGLCSGSYEDAVAALLDLRNLVVEADIQPGGERREYGLIAAAHQGVFAAWRAIVFLPGGAQLVHVGGGVLAQHGAGVVQAVAIRRGQDLAA